MSHDLVNTISRLFIARKDVKAIQDEKGAWKPHTVDGKYKSDRVPWRRRDLEDHLDKGATYGHYILSENSEAKLFAFDIDLRENRGEDKKDPFQGYWVDDEGKLHPTNPRVDWQNRAHPARNYLKYELKMAATKLLASISDYEIHGAVAYSGSKGLHVYGFTGLMPASDIREGASMIIEEVGKFHPTNGDNFYQGNDQEPGALFRNLSIEVFPKQGSLDSKGLGNLMRLPLGVNKKNPRDPTFFVDMTTPMATLAPREPLTALTCNPWKTTDEL